jgi:hypothetical protein
MNTAELVRSDHEAMVIVGTFALAQGEPAMWERFIDRLFDEWAKPIGGLGTIEGRDATGRPSETEDALASVSTPAANSDSEPAPDVGAGAESG